LSVHLQLWYSGATYKIYAVATATRCQVRKDFDGFKRRNKSAHARIITTMEHVAESGPDDLPKGEFDWVRNGCCEIKDHDSGCRLFAYTDPTRGFLVITRMWIKAGRREQDEHIRVLLQERTTAKLNPLPIFAQPESRK
jgi:hypothetical protein